MVSGTVFPSRRDPSGIVLIVNKRKTVPTPAGLLEGQLTCPIGARLAACVNTPALPSNTVVNTCNVSATNQLRIESSCSIQYAAGYAPTFVCTSYVLASVAGQQRQFCVCAYIERSRDYSQMMRKLNHHTDLLPFQMVAQGSTGTYTCTATGTLVDSDSSPLVVHPDVLAE